MRRKIKLELYEAFTHVPENVVKPRYHDHYRDDRRRVLVNIFHHQGIADDLHVDIDTPDAELPADIDAFDRRLIGEKVGDGDAAQVNGGNFDDLLDWAVRERIAQDTLHIAQRLKLQGPAHHGIIDRIQDQVRAVYEEVLRDDLDEGNHNEAIAVQLGNFQRFIEGEPFVVDGRNITIPNLYGATGQNPDCFLDTDVFGFIRGGVLPVNRPDYIKTKVAANLHYRIQEEYFKETNLLHDIETRRLGENFDGILYRGVVPLNDETRARLEGRDPLDPTVNPTIAPRWNRFNADVKTAWRREIKRNAIPTSTSFSPQMALKYAFDGKTEAVRGNLYVIKVPTGQESPIVLSPSEFNGYCSRFWEITGQSIPTEWIEKTLTVVRHSKNKYEIVEEKANPFFYRYLGERGRGVEERALENRSPSLWQRFCGCFGMPVEHMGNERTVADIFKKGVRIERDTPWYNKLYNNVWMPFIQKVFKKGGTLKKKLYITEEDIGGEHKYMPFDVQENEYEKVRKSQFPKVEGGRHTSKRSPLYRSETEYRTRYTPEVMEDRRDEDAAKNIGYCAQLANVRDGRPALSPQAFPPEVPVPAAAAAMAGPGGGAAPAGGGGAPRPARGPVPHYHPGVPGHFPAAGGGAGQPHYYPGVYPSYDDDYERRRRHSQQQGMPSYQQQHPPRFDGNEMKGLGFMVAALGIFLGWPVLLAGVFLIVYGHHEHKQEKKEMAKEQERLAKQRTASPYDAWEDSPGQRRQPGVQGQTQVPQHPAYRSKNYWGDKIRGSGAEVEQSRTIH